MIILSKLEGIFKRLPLNGWIRPVSGVRRDANDGFDALSATKRFMGDLKIKLRTADAAKLEDLYDYSRRFQKRRNF